MNYYNRYPGDYARKTQDLSLMEHGAYTLLLDHLYGTQQVLPKNPVGLFRVTRAFTKEEQDAVLSVIKRFFIEGEDGYTNQRFEEERIKAKARIDAARENGKKGGRKQIRTQKEPSGLDLGSIPLTQQEPSGSAYHQPSTISHQSSTKSQGQKKETQGKPARFDPMVMDLPECVKPSAWESWIEYRRSRKLTCTETTMQAQLKNLDAWWNDGHDPNGIIQASISNGWQGLFPPKGVVPAVQAKCSMTNAEIARIAVAKMREMQNDGE